MRNNTSKSKLKLKLKLNKLESKQKLNAAKTRTWTGKKGCVGSAWNISEGYVIEWPI